MFFNLFDKITVVYWELQFLNSLSSIIVTLSGIVIDCNPEFSNKLSLRIVKFWR